MKIIQTLFLVFMSTIVMANQFTIWNDSKTESLIFTQENERAWVRYIFLANMISHLETCCDTFYVHFRSLRCRVTHSSYSSTTYIDYTLQTAQLQRQLTFQITFALYGLKEALSYSRRQWRFAKFTTQILQSISIFPFSKLQISRNL